MKIIAVLSMLFIFSFILPTFSTAQTNEWTLITSAQDTLRSCTIGILGNGVVNLICGDSVVTISVDSLKMLFRRGQSHFWRGAGYGTLAGVIVGAMVGAAIYQKPTGASTISNLGIDWTGLYMLNGAILGATAGFTMGGIVGAVSGGDELYNLSQKSKEEKIMILRELRMDK